MVFVDWGKTTEIVKKNGSESGLGCDLAPKLGQIGTRWVQIAAKLGPSCANLDQVGVKLVRVLEEKGAGFGT